MSVENSDLNKGTGQNEEAAAHDFIREIIVNDNQTGKHNGRVATRFPPEPNGYLHIGHAKSICLNFGVAQEFKGTCNLRYDDTNPTREDVEYVESIEEDVRWLGFKWDGHFFASDYFEKIYDYAVQLIKKGLAYVDDSTPEKIIEYRGAPNVPGKESPYRNRSIVENLDLFQRMRAGEFEDGSRVLRAKIDMASPNIHMRDPVLYRIRKVPHHRTGDAWCIYPMYDFTHPLSDMLEGITHSLCTLEFEVHRPLYDWLLNVLETPCHPQQIEFARLNLSYTLMSKRKLLQMVEEKFVEGWDDPRMPTIAGLRRRGFTPEAIRTFCRRIGVTKFNGLTDMAVLEHAIREDLNKRAKRAMAVLRPLKLVITNFPEGQVEELEAINNPEDPNAGTRKVPFGRELYIEQEDFMENPPKKFFRLSPGSEVRLRYAYIIKCEKLVKDAAGNVIEVHCSYDPQTRSGMANAGKKVKATIHWVSAQHAKSAEVRLYDRMFTVEEPGGREDQDFRQNINPNSLEVLRDAKLEPSLLQALPGEHYQFERLGYFFVDPKAMELVFNRTVTLKDSWAKEQKK